MRPSVLLIGLLLPFPNWAYQTDMRDLKSASLPPNPPVGVLTKDSNYNTWYMRLTDKRDGINCMTNYSYYPSFNKNSSFFFVSCDDPSRGWSDYPIKLHRFDPAQFKILSTKTIGTDQTTLPLSQGIWSGTDPNLLLTAQGNSIYSYNAATAEIKLIKNFEAEFPGEYIWQMHRSLNDQRFSWTRKRTSDYAKVGWAVWDRPSNSIVMTQAVTPLDEVQLDKTGRYLVVKRDDGGNPEGQIVDLQTKVVTNLDDKMPDDNIGHSDNGIGTQIGEENQNGFVLVRSLNQPSQSRKIADTHWSWGGHYSMLADDESWALVSANGGSSVLGEELFLLATDGSERVKRLIDHHSIYSSYYDSPRATISRDGQYVIFSSNWGASGNTDAYILKVDFNPGSLSPVVSANPLDSIRVFPNPWRADRHTRLVQWTGGPSGMRIKLYTLSGHLVRKLQGDTGEAEWNLLNDSGERVASGIYMYLIEDNQGNKRKGKLALIQ